MRKTIYPSAYIINRLKYVCEDYKRYPNIMINYDDILFLFPDYSKVKIGLENETFLEKKEVDELFVENYKNSVLYKKLVHLAMSKDDIYDFMNHNKDVNYKCLKNVFDKCVESSISLCELIHYIGHYPDTWPFPIEEEKNPKMEKLFEKYDIIVRYYVHDDVDKMQIVSDDVVRILEKLSENLQCINSIKEKVSNDDWLFTKNKSDKEMQEECLNTIQHIDDFPLSFYQMQRRSRREEEMQYLKLQFRR